MCTPPLLLVAPLFPFLFPPSLRVRSAGCAVSEQATRRCEADLLRRHDVAVEDVQQLPEPSLCSHVAYLNGVDIDPHVSFDERGMLGGKYGVDVDSVKRVNRLVWIYGLILQHVQQLLEPPLGSHLPYQGGIRLAPLGLAHGRIVFRGQLSSDGDTIQRLAHNSLQILFPESRPIFLPP